MPSPKLPVGLVSGVGSATAAKAARPWGRVSVGAREYLISLLHVAVLLLVGVGPLYNAESRSHAQGEGGSIICTVNHIDRTSIKRPT